MAAHKIPVIERLSRKSKLLDNGCIEWTGQTNQQGYGGMEIDGHHRGVHRVALELHLGRPIREGMQVDHTCNNRKCINVIHLRECSIRENLFAGHSKTPARLNSERTECLHGHPLDGMNGRKERYCKECSRQKSKRYRESRV